MKQLLYLECGSGISGDMMAGALLDLGADRQMVQKALDSLPLEGFRIAVRRVKKSGLDACDFCVELDEAHENHDHDMKYLYGKENEHELPHLHEPSHLHEHPHLHEPGHPHQHKHEHRGLNEILRIIAQADMTDGAKKLARKIFMILAEAEAKAHGVGVEEVHFHEVGAVDSIVDIVTVAVCLDALQIGGAIVPHLNEGRGMIRCQHGLMPVPVPAVVHIAAAHGLPLHITKTEGELVTPTGAAIAAALKVDDALPERFSIQRVGMGAGKRMYDRPSLLRVMLLKEKSTAETDKICKIESNIDDCSGEALGFAMHKLLEAGARDVFYSPVLMKKNRPAYLLTVLCETNDREKMEQIIFAETTTIGVRYMEMERSILKRETRRVKTTLGEAAVKLCAQGEKLRCYPEYDSVAKLCEKHQLPYREVYRRVQEEAMRGLDGGLR